MGFLVGLNRRADFICLQWLKISLLLFSSAKSCLYMIYNFSFVQSWQVPVTGENGLPLSIIFHVIFGWIPWSLSSQTYLLKDVWMFCLCLYLKESVWTPN